MRGLRRDTSRRRSGGRGVSGRGALCVLVSSWLVVFAIGAGLVTQCASAATGHSFISTFSEAPLGMPFVEPDGVAVEQSSGKLFVADPGKGVIDVFGSSGSFETQFGGGALAGVSGLAVDEETHDVYVAEALADAVLVFKPDGKGGYELLSEWLGASTPEKEFGDVEGVAVDNSTSGADPHAGDVYVVDGANNAVYTFKPAPVGPEEGNEGAFVSTLSGGNLEGPNGVAVDSATGRIYVADSEKGLVEVYGSSGSFETKLTGSGSPIGSFFGPEGEEGNVTGVAINQATGELYVAEAERRVVSQFNSEGKWIGWVTDTPSGPLDGVRGVAIGPTGELYLADAGRALVDVFGADVVVPDAKTSPASKAMKTTVILNGVVNGDGKLAKYGFQWGTSEALGSQTPMQSAGAGEEKVSFELSGLKPGSTYYFRLVTENEDGTNVGAVREFVTRPAVELSTGSAQDVTPSEATLTGTLEPRGIDTHYYFEWGKTGSYGATSPTPPGTDAGASKESVAAQTDLSGLAPNTSYHYRLVGEDVFGSTAGEDRKFTTSGPPRITSEATTGLGHEAATIHARVDPDELETEYHFEYGETSAYGTELPVGGAKLAPGELPVSVSASLASLKIGVTYHFRLVASNHAGTTVGPDQTFTTIPPALIESESTAEVKSTEATLETQIDPLGHDTTYQFQYGNERCMVTPASCTDVPATPVDIGSSESGQAEHVHVQELKPATTYYYRVLATNSLGTAEGPEHAFTTQEAAEPFALADGRAWEMVSPSDKHGSPIEALTREGGLILAAEDGDSVTYVADGSITEEPQGDRTPEMQQILSTRDPAKDEWVTQDIDTPNSREEGVSVGSAPEYQFFTPDLSQALVAPWGVTPLSEPPLSPGATQKTMYLRDDANGTYLPLVTEANVPPDTEFGDKLHFLSATSDLSHVVLESQVPLTPPPAAAGLYEWAGGKLQFVSLLPGGTSAAGSPELGFFDHVLADAISNDGSRIVWTNKEDLNTRGGHLYMRDTATDETIQLDAAQGIPEPEKGSAQFQTASTNGSKVFFTDRQRLTADSTAEVGTGSGKPDLYECEMTEEAGKLTCDLKDLTVDHNEGEHAAVQGLVLGAGEDGSSVYLIAQGVLAENENGAGEAAQAGKDNLYALQFNGAQWTTSFVAGMSSEDRPEWEGNGVGDSAFLSARVSPNGRFLAFMSMASPTGYDNVDQNSGAHDEEVYLYDAADSSLRCVSCAPTGERPVGVLDTVESGEGLGIVADRRELWVGHWLAGNIPGWTAESLKTALFQSRYLSDEGRLFFDSPGDLVPDASNHKEDVYEYEPSGLGSCESPSGGCVSLLSSGSSDEESAFLEATPSGNDVFFLTAAQLVPQDTDTAFDIYDARVCTVASACLTPVVPAPAGCGTADACRPASPSQQAPIGPLGSTTSSHSGNIVQPRQEVKGVKTTSKPLTRAQKLAAALKTCKKQRSKRKRRACEAHARKLYGPKVKSKKARTKKPEAKRSGAQSNTRTGRW
jgi:uncharacterized protein YjiK